jgi:Ser/Thr protein kinase RdoA (MazF antagonist)
MSEQVRRGILDRAKISTNLFDTLNHHYGIDNRNDVLDLGGSSNLNLLVTDSTSRYVARLYRSYVTAARLEALQFVRGHLARNGVPCIEPIRTCNGNWWAVVDNSSGACTHATGIYRNDTRPRLGN